MIFPLDWYRSPSEATPPLLIQPSNLFLCPCHLAEGCLSTSMNCCHHWCIQVAAQPATVSQLIQSSSIQWVSSTCVWNSLDWALELSQSEWSLPGGTGSPMGLGWRQGCWVRENEVNLLITSNLGGQGPSFLPSLWVILPPAMWAMEIDFVGIQRICRGGSQRWTQVPSVQRRTEKTVHCPRIGDMTHLPFPLATSREALPQMFFLI